MEEDVIYIKQPSRRRSLGFGSITLVSILIVGGVWFYLMENIIVDATSDVRLKSQEFNELIENYHSQDINQDVSGFFEVTDQVIQPTAPTVQNSPNVEAALEAVASVIQTKVIDQSDPNATSDQQL